MAIEVQAIKRRYLYNGVTLPDIPGMGPKEVRDVYSAQYPELVSAEIELGEVRDGVQEITFKRAVGTKGCAAFPGGTGQGRERPGTRVAARPGAGRRALA